MIIRARCIQRIGEAAMDNGAMIIEGGRIAWLGKWRDCEGRGRMGVQDLGEVVVMPGLINAHCHLDFTAMGGKIPPPTHFPDWVKTMLSLKAHWGYSEYAESWLRGARMLVESGTTTVCDIESFPELLPESWSTTPLRVFSFLEMTAVKDQRQAEAVLEETLGHLQRIEKEAKHRPGLSPHALYSTTPELMRKSVVAARERNLPLTTHIAESEAEFRMFQEAGGPFHDWLKNQRRMEDCGGKSPVQLLHEYEVLNRTTLLAHANYLAAGDEEIIARSAATVVHCPRSHQYFRHHAFPFERLDQAGVNLCLGTDSLATTLKVNGQEPRLDLWAEMRLFATKKPGVRPQRLFEMVTVNPARAMDRTGEFGQIAVNAAADLVGVLYSGKPAADQIYETVLHEPRIAAVFIGGEAVHFREEVLTPRTDS